MLGAVSVALSTSGCDLSELPFVREEEVEVGYRGRARIDPFLALTRFLERMEVPWEPRYALTEIPDTGTVLVLPSEADTSPATARRLLTWVEEGGHLCYWLHGGNVFLRPWDPDELETEAEEEGAIPRALLEELGIEIAEGSAVGTEVVWAGRSYEVEIDAWPAFSFPMWIWRGARGMRTGSRDESPVLQMERGRGRITFVGSAELWRNRKIGEKEHATLLWKMLRSGGTVKAIWYLRRTQTSFFSLLWTYGWMALLSLAVYLVFWLWRSMPRFGPMVPDEEEASRDFQHHLAMTGQFLWSHDQAGALTEPILRRVRRRLGGGRRMTDSAVEDENLRRAAIRAEVPEERLRRLLEKGSQGQAREFVENVKALQRLDPH